MVMKLGPKLAGTIVLGLSALLALVVALALAACDDAATTHPDATATAGVAATASTSGPEAGPTRVVFVGALDVDPRDPSVLYAATTEGLFKSDDGAESWHRLPGTFRGFYRTVAVDPAAPSTIYAIYFKDDAVPSGRLQRSDDGGATWVNLSDARSPRIDGYAVVWFDLTATPSSVYTWGVTCGVKGRDWHVYRSSDRGETWTRDRTAEQRDPPWDPGDVPRQMSAAARQALDAFMAEFQPSGGRPQAWILDHTAEAGPLLNIFGRPLVDPRDPSVFYARTMEGVYKSLDGGKTWRRASAGLRAALPAVPATPPLPAPIVAGTLVFDKVVDPDTPNYDIFLVNSDGTGLRQLTDDPGVEEHPCWSPDGKRIVYSDYEKGTLRVMNADGSGDVALGGGGAPHWSPDGRLIVYSRGDGVYVMNADGSSQRRVDTRGPADTPSWGPNGTIVFVRDGDLYDVNVDGTGLVRLTRNAGLRQCLASPDGKGIAAYVVGEDRLVVMPLRGDGPTVTLLHPALPYIPDGGEPTAGWTADGRALVLGSSTWGERLGSHLYVVNADGSGLSQVPRVENALSAAWRPE